MELLKLLSANEIVAQAVSFLILLFLMRILFWKRILKVLDERRERITSELKKIEEAKLEVSGLKSEYETQLDFIDEKAREKIRDAVEEGKTIVGEMTKEAHQEAQKIIESAKQDIKYEIAKAKEEMRDEIVDLTIKSAQNLIGEKLTEADDKKLVEDFLKQLDKAE